ncbi:MAG TPA: MBL fold metallo-hydrolase [Patescibacteria group bacterium]|nr:MBL fold metallo-hydrolase [Patescibacteria group bacterium]
MQISWNGFSSFEIITKTSSGDVRLVTDPYQNSTGLRFPRTLEAEILLESHDEEDANNREAVVGSPYIIDLPGEFEVRSVFVFGVSAVLKREEKGRKIQNLLFRIETEGMRLAHLGALDRPLTDEELQKLENIDILMIPVGGGRYMDPSIASEVISQIEPRVVIPMTHALPSMKEPLSSIDDFCKAFGTCRREDMNKYKVTRKDLPEEDMVIISLTR